jgi:exopolysaccharide biosynthesis protein
VIGGRLVNRGHYRTAIGIRNNGTIEFRHRASGRFNWSGFKAGLAAGPRLVHESKIDCDPVADGFGPGSVTLSAPRSGVGITADNRLLLVTTTSRFTLAQFAEVMLELECTEAMNLDGGGACALYRDGRFLELPGLPMANLLVVYKK